MVVKHERRDIADSLRDALRSLVRPVGVVTAERDGVRYAMAATAFCEVSMMPPSMLVCVNRSNATWKAISLGADIGINLLSESQAEVCNLCSGGASGDSKFEVGDWLLEPGRPPRLADSCAAIVLRPTQLVDQGTHSIVIGEIIDIAHQRHLAPLAFHEGDYMFPLASAALNLMSRSDGTLSTHNFLISRLMSAFYWFDEAMQNALQKRGWPRVSRSQSMAFANMAMGICRPADIARNLGISRQAVSNMLKEMAAEGLVEIRPDPNDRRASIVSYSEKSLQMRNDAMGVLTQLEAIVADRIGGEALATLRDALARDWGPVPDLPA